jgi:flagellar biosynthesis protein FlhB
VFDDQGKTEKPTQKQRNKARKEGRVARSIEVNSAAVLLATIAVLMLTAPRLLSRSEAIMSDGLGRAGSPSLASTSGLHELTMWGLHALLVTVAPIAGAAMVAGILASVLQVGVKFTPKSLQPSFAKLNPLAGLKRMFSPSQTVELSKSLAKTGVVAAVAFFAVWPRIPTLGTLVGMPPGAILVQTAGLVSSVALRVALALAVIAALDYAWQRHRHEKSLRMTKEELRKEAKESDVSPELKGALRRRQSEAARRRMMADVPTADVVVVNPTHYAVALRYDGSKVAPEVIAKGVDLLAAAIRRAAEEAGVTIVHEPPLARALYRDVELGHMIPEELFAAVAQVLAFVFRTARRRVA